MNSSELFTKQFSISGFTLVVAGLIFLTAIFILLMNLVSVQKKLKVATTPKFGFAGKPIYPVIATLLISLSIPLALYSVSQQTSFQQEAEENVVLNYDYKILSREGENITVEFNFIPYVDSKAWGDKNFDIFWEFEGKVSESKYEFNKNAENPSSVVLELPKGIYKVTLLVAFDSATEHFVKESIIE